jgi:agarase
MLLEAFATEYFRIVDEALDSVLPNHLYMGVRMAHWGMTPEVIRAAERHTDVMSFNFYKEGLRDVDWAFLDAIDMPCIIGEYHVGSTDSGLFHPGLIVAGNQADRARMYREYMETVIDNPYFVGAHWFQYIDSPLTGRAYDGENYNVGFVTITDRPYPEMTAAARNLHRYLYPRRFSGVSPVQAPSPLK